MDASRPAPGPAASATDACPRCGREVTRALAHQCRDCLAHHHARCWAEAERCDRCGSTRVLRPAVRAAAPDGACEVAGCGEPAVARGLLGSSRYCAEHAAMARVAGLMAGAPLLVLGLVLVVAALVVGEPALLLAAAVVAGVGGLLVRRPAPLGPWIEP